MVEKQSKVIRNKGEKSAVITALVATLADVDVIIILHEIKQRSIKSLLILKNSAHFDCCGP
jgi:hypothetical protein